MGCGLDRPAIPRQIGLVSILPGAQSQQFHKSAEIHQGIDLRYLP